MNDPQSPERVAALFWRVNANCLGVDDEIFYEQDKLQDEEAAKKICAECVVRGECLVYALLTEQKDYIWGGKTTAERDAIVHGRSESVI